MVIAVAEKPTPTPAPSFNPCAKSTMPVRAMSRIMITAATRFAADSALKQLRRQPSDAAALHDYNFALSRVFSTIRVGKIDVWSKPLSVPGYVVTQRKDA